MYTHYGDRMTGILEGTDGKVLFCSDKYLFTFMTRERLEKGHSEVIIPKDGFVFATAHNGNNVAIYTGTRIITIDAYQSTIQFYTELFFVSEFPLHKADLQSFQYISFRGGVLDRLKPDKLIEASYDEQNEDIISVERTMTSAQYSFSTQEYTCELKTGVVPSDFSDVDSMTLKNEAYLSLKFDKGQPISSFFRHYQHVRSLVSFMTFRTDTPFNVIQIIPSHENGFSPMMHVFVHYKENEKTAPHHNSCITFDMLGESVVNLMSIFYNSKQKKPSYSLGFIPTSDEERWLVTDDTVRSVSSALECEASLDKEVGVQQDAILTELCENVKQLVEEHRNKHKHSPVLTEGTYNLIFGSIRNWSMSAFDRISFIFHKHENALKKLPILRRDQVTEEDIHAFITYRNSTSHGTYREMTEQIRKTTLTMEMLVYCCLLHRIGVSDETIEKICSKHFS